jgi:hypothetical protein
MYTAHYFSVEEFFFCGAMQQLRLRKFSLVAR